ncbi:MAG: hypothetical protein ACKOOC_02345 [Cyanobium sp.]
MRDFRRPGHALEGLHTKLPSASLQALDAQAQRLQTTRGALARALLLQGLAELEEACTGQELA